MELLDGSRLISKDKRALGDADSLFFHVAGYHEDESAAGTRHTRSVSVHEAGFIHYMDTGIWHLAFYNDGRNTEQVSYNTIVIGETCRIFMLQLLFTFIPFLKRQILFLSDMTYMKTAANSHWLVFFDLSGLLIRIIQDLSKM